MQLTTFNNLLIDIPILSYCSCNNLIDRLRFKLEFKDFETVKLYSKTEKYRAAVTSSLSFLEKYPNSIFKENTWYILINNSFLLSKNSTNRKKKQEFRILSKDIVNLQFFIRILSF